ncbi:GW dipeptide domain-containing protein [Terribacillus saccharophilus]|uniref:GW dipeptide domain-containing protein n=1 Tax=Terribacillus saccharophilus TaxID=361277 RepID=UPI002DC5E54E|nr:GW dipeptide domain-containing protein [Terribacillus saccharophilus]MEC0291203.1 GW dipeptide domain-containing protein [Terribacillus saccharophilus]
MKGFFKGIIISVLIVTSFPMHIFAEEGSVVADPKDDVLTNEEQESAVEADESVTEENSEQKTAADFEGNTVPASQEDTGAAAEEIKSDEQSGDDKEEAAEEESSTSQTESNSEAAEEEAEYNEFGIKKGTMVYGEDISKLTEEELQYVPKGWRDGKIEETEEGSEDEPRLFAKASYPNVNNYIKDKKFKVVSYQYEYKNIFEKFNYRNGYGAVEGVVAHETANNNSTIRNEINFMSNNHENAFVHAFVDDSNIIEIHPTEYGAWGAGRYANQRFVHVELVRVNSFDEFARSINNYADYIANVLNEYNLGVTDAEGTGKGTLWSHNAVSKYLGGTNHVDPHGYFAKYGYNWSEFVTLVKQKYNEKAVEIKSENKLGHVKSTSAKLYGNIRNLNSSEQIGSSRQKRVYYIRQKAVVDNNTYYQISAQDSASSGVVGWINAKDMDTRDTAASSSATETFIIKGTGETYTNPWGGTSDRVHLLKYFTGQKFVVDSVKVVGGNLWYRGTIEGKKVWTHASYLKNDVTESNVSLIGHLKKNASIYSSIENMSKVTSGNSYIDKVYFIKKQAKTASNTYYLISSSPSSATGVIGWVSAKQLNTHTHKTISSQARVLYLRGTGTSYTKPWGGSKDVVLSSLSKYKNKEFYVDRTEKVGDNYWYHGKVDGKTMWIHTSYLTTKVESNTSKLSHLKANAVIYKDIDFKEKVTDKTKYTDTAYYIKKEVKYNGNTLYLISLEASSSKGVVGWVKSSQIDSRTHVGVNKDKKTLYLRGTGTAYTKAWGGTTDKVFDLAKYKNYKFAVNKTEKVGNNYWYRGILQGREVWIHTSYLTKLNESKTSKLGHLRSSATIYEQPGVKEGSRKAGSSNLNTVYYIKKQASLNGITYYLISQQASSSKGVVGWVAASDMSVHTHVGVDQKRIELTIRGTGSSYTKAWGGSKDKVYNLNAYKNQKFIVNKTEKVGDNYWYRGTLNGKEMFIHTSYLKK